MRIGFWVGFLSEASSYLRNAQNVEFRWELSESWTQYVPFIIQYEAPSTFV